MSTRLSALMGASLFFVSGAMGASFPATMDLSGTWKFQLDIADYGQYKVSALYKRELNDTIQLPGTTDQAGKGIDNPARHIDRLTRKFEYVGPAWYQKEVFIPEEWKDKDITLTLECCHWDTKVYVDGEPAGADDRLSTPNRFKLGKQLTPGNHTITIRMDNRMKYPMDQAWSHAVTENTQTNWNGIVGEISLTAREKLHIDKVKVSPNVTDKSIRIDTTLSNADKEQAQGKLIFTVKDKDGHSIANNELDVTTANSDQTTVTRTVALGDSVKLWNDIDPNLYDLDVTWNGPEGKKDSHTVTFGMREVAQGKHHVQLNGRDIHLRGTVDNATFPITGYASADPAEWERIFRTLKDYGLNHARFHSWCPPRAAFEAADKIGIYLQAELPLWVRDIGKHPDRRTFFEKELYAILDEYGNHPSFLLMCNGNELMGDYNVLEDLIKKGQAHDSRHLYSVATARKHVPSDQFYTSHVTPKGSITVYEGKPSTMWDRNKESDFDVPVIAHEAGQRCMYPNFDEMKKYTGVLLPRNFEIFRERLADNGMLGQAQEFFEATGAHTVLQYKEVVEALLRSSKSGGFQMLGLNDYPGQGTAFVGILDSFWESKGLISPEQFREFCAPSVLLCRIPQRVYSQGDTLESELEVYHFGNTPLPANKLAWQLTGQDGKAVREGTLDMKETPCSTVDPIGKLSIPLEGVAAPGKYTLNVNREDGLRNSWDIWVYPASQKQETADNFVLARSWDDSARQALADGKTVLLVPKDIKGRKTKFSSFFWNPIMFRWDPFIIGTLIHKDNPAFAEFPTEKYADWQWWDILNNAHALDLTDARALTPVIQSIDTYEFNRKLGIAFEANVGKGKLFVFCVDIDKDMDKRPATRQLLHSIRQYVGSDRFSPTSELSIAQLDSIFGDPHIKPADQKNDETTRRFHNK